MTQLKKELLWYHHRHNKDDNESEEHSQVKSVLCHSKQRQWMIQQMTECSDWAWRGGGQSVWAWQTDGSDILSLQNGGGWGRENNNDNDDDNDDGTSIHTSLLCAFFSDYIMSMLPSFLYASPSAAHIIITKRSENPTAQKQHLLQFNTHVQLSKLPWKPVLPYWGNKCWQNINIFNI